MLTHVSRNASKAAFLKRLANASMDRLALKRSVTASLSSVYPNSLTESLSSNYTTNVFWEIGQDEHPNLAPRRFLSTTSTLVDLTDEEEETDDIIEKLPRFKDLNNLSSLSKKAIEGMGIETMSEIQSKTWEAAVSGKDVLGRARTGTGKTLAFLLPGVEQILQRRDAKLRKRADHQIEMLILSPTRELAFQIGEQTRAISSAHGPKRLSHQTIVGGSSKHEDTKRFHKKLPSVLVATPGRLLDHLENTYVRDTPFGDLLSNVKVLVIDEMDRLLDMGFKADVDRIISYLPPKNKRQTLLFSATLPPDVRQTLKTTVKPDFETIDCIRDHDPTSHTNAQVLQSHVLLPFERLVSGTVELLLHAMDENNGKNKIVVFFPTTNLVKFYSRLFNYHLGRPVLELHAKKSQSFRTSASNRFRELKKGVLFTSDVSARGVDYPDVTRVIQVGMADSRETYIHRLGRTGRAGKKGQGLLILSEAEENILGDYLHGLDIPLHEELQILMDNPYPTTHVADALEPILETVRDKSDSELSGSVKFAYLSMLGFYSGRLQHLGDRPKQKLVELVNAFSAGAGCAQPPEVPVKTAQNIGLLGLSGLRIGNGHSGANSRPRGGRGGRDGRGGRGGRGFGGRGRGGHENNGRYQDKEYHGDRRFGRSPRGGKNSFGGAGRGSSGKYGGGSIKGTGQYDDWGRSK
mmetsp:Transcript_21286/g.32768  ORF Transcript_21286/g.32768 Transcript_21286/m.32768 type:complete len:691 (+) Transcript_21286:213-2285(+)